MKQATSFTQADLTMSRSSCFKPSAPMASTPTLNRRQLLSGMAVSTATVLLAGKSLATGVYTNISLSQPMSAFEALRFFLQASARPR